MRNLNDIVINEDIDNDVLEIKNKLPDDFDVKDYLLKKGIEFKEHESSSTGTWLQMCCPFPEHDDKRPSFSINVESKSWNCYVCGSGNWFQLAEKMGWEDWKSDQVLINTISNEDWKKTKRNFSKRLEGGCYVAIKPKMKNIKQDDKYFEYLKNRKIESSIDIFEIKRGSICYDEDYNYNYRNRILIPVHNLDETKILWYEGRHIEDKFSPKYYRPNGVEKTKVIFNYHRVKQSGSKKVIVVEGIIDAITLWMWGYPAVCIFGSSISPDQMELLMCFDEIYICLDIDRAGIKGFLKFKELCTGCGALLKRIIIPRGKDANKLKKLQFDEFYNRSKSIDKNK